MRDKIIKPERRRVERRRLDALANAVDEAVWAERRVHCWDLERECTEERRKRCSAYFVRRNCWDLWAAEYFPPGRKPCCHPDLDCAECPVASAKFSGPVAIHVAVPPRLAGSELAAASAGRGPTLCPYLYTSREGQSEKGDGEARPVFKCRRRHGIMLHSTYISDVCSRPEYRECTFYGTD